MTSPKTHLVPDSGDDDRWLLTYSDMITLLLAVFVVLFALSSVNKVKLSEFSTGLRATFVGSSEALGSTSLLTQPNLGAPKPLKNPVRGLSSPVEATKPPATHPSGATTPSTTTGSSTQSASSADHAELAALERTIHSKLSAEHLLPYVTISLRPDSLTVGLLADSVFFATNSNALSRIGNEIVDTVGRVLAPRTNKVSVQGYADNVPVTGPPWHSNFLLSAARATSVVERMTHVDGVAEPRLVAEGFGSTHPIASNATAAGRATNRRVEIVIQPERT